MDNSKSYVIRVFSKQSHARDYCDYKNMNNSSSSHLYYYDTEELMSGRTADYFLRTLLEEKFEKI